jgi:hypothetical protein
VTPKEKVDLYYTIENEGFDYAFNHYSDFQEIIDPEFHRLREAYINAQKNLEKYIDPTEEDFEIAEAED